MVKINKKKLFKRAVFALLFLFAGFLLAGTGAGAKIRMNSKDNVSRILLNTVESISQKRDLSMRNRVLLENPELIIPFKKTAGFGGEFSQVIGLNMFSTIPEAVADAYEKTRIEKIADRTWMIYMPFVNSVLFETDEGLVLVDTGVASAGPALYSAVRSVSDKPVHTIIYTHGHVDHAYGTWSFIEEGETPRIIAHKNLPERFDRYVELRGSLARYMSQPEEQMPDDENDFVWPDTLIDEKKDLIIGGEKFELFHYKGETDDQLFVWVPGRKALCSADYYQSFLPNGGNGKRVQRYIGEWADAIEAMLELDPEILLPAHGQAITDKARIKENLTVLHEALDYIVTETIRQLNAGVRKDSIPLSISLPAELAEHPTLKEQYVTAGDLSKMVIKQYTGWWDELPSHWNRPPLESEAELITALAGGTEALVDLGLSLLDSDPQMASIVADWAWLANPENQAVEEMVIKVYKARIMSSDTMTQERLAYLDHIMRIRAQQLAGEL